jgi:hypothetical protein
MRQLLSCLIFMISVPAWSDTINNYMNIVSNIPTMEMKADANSQAWARSAKNVLTITNEGIAEALLEANRLAQSQGSPLFCLPNNTPLNADSMKVLIEKAYQTMPNVQTEKDKLTVSQVAWLAVTHDYPCKTIAQPNPYNPNSPPNPASSAPVSLMQHQEG